MLAILAHPNLNFIIILNPHDGPGSSPLPDEDYGREIRRLTARPNVRTVGYVRINYCKRDVTTVYEEIVKYAGWSKDHHTTGWGVHGIFFDETPNLYSDKAASYLDIASQTVKATPGILGDRMVIHNPGTVPDAGLAAPGPDVTTVLEEPYKKYRSAALQERLSTLMPYDRPRCSYMVHSVPREKVKELVFELRCRGEFLFVTDQHYHFYTRFGSSWSDFIEAMDIEC
ncbi:hypothetical protein GJ744_008151 [Endocarpon pusillum]|uniref:Uncharacterized protein n=1 Tax=Endocarpon pusillum TaxID=364733 RepID=A0A8H7ALR0_9EURO|nr:hypothetical protein GJ744_008151 [Endocarpon pusillum]